MKISSVLRGGISVFPLLKQVEKLDESSTPEQLVNCAMQFQAVRPVQVPSEFLALAELVKKQNCRYMLEIGSYRGGTLFVFSRLSDAGAAIVSVDYSFDFVGRFLRIARNALLRRLIRRGQSLFMLRRNSHSPDTVTDVQKILRGNKLDFLFIDGDHSYAGVRADFEMYVPLVRSGGLVAFHDINLIGPPGYEFKLEVNKYWNEVKQNYVHTEFVHQAGAEAMGIGVLWV
jgi:cephalosporin hydroxylase